MNIRWTPEATTDLEHIGQHNAEDHPEAALKTVAERDTSKVPAN